MVDIKTEITTDKFGIREEPDGATRTKFAHLKNRFRVTMTGFAAPIGSKNLTLEAKKVSLPKITFAEQKIEGYGHETKYAGKETFGDVSITVLNSIDNVIYKELLRQKQLQSSNATSVTATAPTNYKFVCNVEHLGGNSERLSYWQYEGCWIKELDFGDVEYGNYDAMMINMTLSIDNMNLFDENGKLVTDQGAISTFINNNLAGGPNTPTF